MPTAHSGDGTPIHYEVEGSGPPVMLYHGLGLSGEWWRIYGYVTALRDSFTLILIDDRAHGASGKPHDPADYVMARRVEDVTAVLDDLEVEKVHFVGFSLGAIIGYGIAKYAPHRLASLVAGGAQPYGPTNPENQTAMAQQMRAVGNQLAVGFMESSLGDIPDEMRRIILANDVEAMIGAVLALRDEPGSDDCLSEINFPFVAFCGSLDPVHDMAERGTAEVPDGKFVTLEGFDHIQSLSDIDAVLAHVRPFLEQAATV